MKIKLNSNGVTVKVQTDDEKEPISFKAIVKAYELVSGDDLEITENDPKTPQRANDKEPESSQWDSDRPDYGERVKVEVACPYCGFTNVSKVSYGYRFMKCPNCHEKIYLSPATENFGEKDEHGYYYKAYKPYYDDESKKVDDDLLNQMKARVEAHEPIRDEEVSEDED